MEIIELLLTGALATALVTQLGTYINDRKKHKEARSDLKEDKQDEILEKIDGVRTSLSAEITSIKSGFDSELTSLKGEISHIKKELSDTRNELTEERMKNLRTKIVRFSDEVYDGKNFSKEHYDIILLAITTYSNYCETHPDFENDVIVEAMAYVKDEYRKRRDNHEF